MKKTIFLILLCTLGWVFSCSPQETLENPSFAYSAEDLEGTWIFSYCNGTPLENDAVNVLELYSDGTGIHHHVVDKDWVSEDILFSIEGTVLTVNYSGTTLKYNIIYVDNYTLKTEAITTKGEKGNSFMANSVQQDSDLSDLYLDNMGGPWYTVNTSDENTFYLKFEFEEDKYQGTVQKGTLYSSLSSTLYPIPCLPIP